MLSSTSNNPNPTCRRALALRSGNVRTMLTNSKDKAKITVADHELTIYAIVGKRTNGKSALLIVIGDDNEQDQQLGIRLDF